MLKTIVLLNIFLETDTFFKILEWIESSINSIYFK